MPDAADNPNMGAGVIFPVKGGKYLLQENEKEPGMPEDKVGTLRPAGGHKSKRDADLRETIVRELGEEFGLKPDFIESRLTLLGYIRDGDFKDCAMFELKDHGLTAKRYSASNSKYETVKLVEASLNDKRYVGKKPGDLRDPKKGEAGYEGVDKKASAGKAYKILKDVGFSGMVNRMRRMEPYRDVFKRINRRPNNSSAYWKARDKLSNHLKANGYDEKTRDFVVDAHTGVPVHRNLMREAIQASAPLSSKTTKKPPSQLGFDIDPPRNNYDWD